MKYSTMQITFQEVPDEISLSFLVTGCSLRCPGCHSSDSWHSKKGTELELGHFLELLDKYEKAITCVCFFGGEWHEEELKTLCLAARGRGLKTCLYTGLEDVKDSIKSVLDFLKVGRFIKERGGLSSPTTNQRLIDLRTNQCLNHHFTAQGGLHGQTE